MTNQTNALPVVAWECQNEKVTFTSYEPSGVEPEPMVYLKDAANAMGHRDAELSELREQVALLERESKHHSDSCIFVSNERDTLQTELTALRTWKAKLEQQKPVLFVNGEHLKVCLDNPVDGGRCVSGDTEPDGYSDTPLYAAPVPAPSQVAAEVVQEAARCVFVMRHIASMGDDEFDGDTVDLRFEDDQGRDTGCDVSISEYAGKAADVIEALLVTSQGEA